MKKQDRYIATKAILNALKEGRQLSQLDCEEFKVEDMRTIVSHLRPKYQDTHDLQFVWITTPVLNRRIKLYWLTPKNS
jgi:hypothetical protein